MVVVATDEEYEFVRKRFKEEEIIKTGVGAINVINALKDLPKDTPILNYGLVGSNKIPKGTLCTISKCKLYHPTVEYDEIEFDLRNGIDESTQPLILAFENYVTCYTSNDFVLWTSIEEPVVFDMELAYILALGFTKVRSVKQVSDTLNLDEYNSSAKNLEKEGNVDAKQL